VRDVVEVREGEMQPGEIRRYLERIGYEGGQEPGPETLRSLHRAHMLSVPFENLDIRFGRPIVLDESVFYEKIVVRRRGGFCYELNGAFCSLLRSLGFEVVMLSAGVARDKGGFGPEFDHMALLVTLEDDWLVDVGFGDSFVEPLLLNEARDQCQACGVFRIAADGESRVLFRSKGGEAAEPQYRFTLQSRELQEFQAMCRYHQSSPESSFTRGRVVTRATPEGRITLSGMRLVTTVSGRRSERELSGEPEFLEVLVSAFGLTLG
jgi:N-hydroxyarylamine O-acetyltransferase